MYINNINILYYLFLGIIGLGIGQFVAWSTVRLPDYKKVFVREFFTIYLKNEKPKYIYMVAMALLYVGVLYLYGFQIKTLAYLALIPMLISALAIDYRLKIIPNRLNLTIFEVGLVYTFVEGIVNINIAIDMLLGMVAGAGIFLFITLVGGLIAGKEAMGFGDVKLMGALGLFFGWRTIIIVSLIAFLLGAIIGVALIICKRKTGDEYIPFGPFIVIATIIAIFVPILVFCFSLWLDDYHFQNYHVYPENDGHAYIYLEKEKDIEQLYKEVKDENDYKHDGYISYDYSKIRADKLEYGVVRKAFFLSIIVSFSLGFILVFVDRLCYNWTNNSF